MISIRTCWAFGVAAAAATLAGFFLAHQLDRASPQLASGTWLPQPKALPQFTLIDTGGHAFTRRELDSAPALVFFGYAHCPDACPTTLLKLAQVRKRAAASAKPRVLFVSVDPQRDTPAVLAAYVHAFDPSFEALTGSPQAIEQLAAAFGVAFNRVELPGGDYTMEHSVAVFLVDDAARIAATFTPPFDVAAFAADLDRAAPYLKSGSARPAT